MLVPQSLTGEVAERVDYRGNVLPPLDEARAARRRCASFAAQGIESIAVCLLFSFLHPQHEARVREIVAEEMPGCAISLSSEVLPQIREYYRLLDHRHQRLPAADPGALHRPARPPARRGRPRDAAEIRHAVERRHGDLRRRRANAR